MNPSACSRGLWLGIAGLSVLLGLVACGFAPSLLFELIGRDRQRWVERFATGYEDVLVQVEEGRGFLPYVLPGPADAWAGGKPHRVRIRFSGPRRESSLLLRLADSHSQSPPLLTVSVNGREAGRLQVRKGMGLDPRDVEGGRPSAYRLEIPAALLDAAGAQTLTLENGQGAWVELAGLQLLRSAPSFAPLHYLRPGPPPRWGLLGLGIGLLAVWATDRRPIRERRASLVLLGAGLGLLALLGIAPWPPTGLARESRLASFLKWEVLGGTPRAGWLLLVLGFAAALAPSLPRVSEPRLLNATAFATGAIVMALEMVGFRLLSPFFGYSIYVWGALLGVVMAALAAGYYLAGRLADRWPGRPLLYQALLGTAVLILAELYAYPFIIRLSVNLALVSGSLLAALLLVFLPMVGLSLTPPFVIRTLAASGRVGSTAGQIYALSTAGSIVGTFGSAFFLITVLGPGAAWELGGLLLLLLSAYALFHHRGRGALVTALLLGLVLILTQPLIPEISVASFKGGMRLYATESEYSHLEIIEVEKTVRLVPQVRFTHTIYDEDRIFDPIVSFGLLPAFLTEPRRSLILGMGGGTLVRLYLHVYPEIRVDGVDIDPEMIRLGKRFMGLREDPRLRIFVEDARAFLAKTPGTPYDLVVVDLWQGGVFIPYYTVTREFFALGRERLAKGGVLTIVIGQPRPLDSPLRQEKYDRLFKAVGNSLAAVFPSVFAYPVGDIANYFVATREPTSLQTVHARLEAIGIPEIRELVIGDLAGLREYRSDPRIPILTDDLAPVDQLIYDAFFRQ